MVTGNLLIESGVSPNGLFIASIFIINGFIISTRKNQGKVSPRMIVYMIIITLDKPMDKDIKRLENELVEVHTQMDSYLKELGL